MLYAFMESMCTYAREQADILAADMFKVGTKSRSALAGVLHHVFSSPEIALAVPTSRNNLKRVRVGELSLTLANILVDTATKDSNEFDTKAALDSAFGYIITAASLSEKYSTEFRTLRWQDVLTYMLNSDEHMEIIDAFTIDGEPITELIVAAITGDAK